MYVYIYIYIYTYTYLYTRTCVCIYFAGMNVLRTGSHPQRSAAVGGDRLSNTTCLTHVFFKRGE